MLDSLILPEFFSSRPQCSGLPWGSHQRASGRLENSVAPSAASSAGFTRSHAPSCRCREHSTPTDARSGSSFAYGVSFVAVWAMFTYASCAQVVASLRTSFSAGRPRPLPSLRQSFAMLPFALTMLHISVRWTAVRSLSFIKPDAPARLERGRAQATSWCVWVLISGHGRVLFLACSFLATAAAYSTEKPRRRS